MLPRESLSGVSWARGKDVGCCCFGGGNTSLSKLLIYLLSARPSARASAGAVRNLYTKLEAKGLTNPLLQIRKMWLRPRADCLHTDSAHSSALLLVKKDSIRVPGI